ncbi:MAG: cyclodeaminase/cyclohydrolase family protein, partial [Actinomycetota bacterium]
DGQAYGQVLAARRDAPDGRAGEDRATAAWTGATEVPLEIAEVAAEVAELAAGLLGRGNPSLLGDVATAIDLAATTAAGAARLVRINVADGGLDHAGGPGAELLARAARACTSAASHAQRQRLP